MEDLLTVVSDLQVHHADTNVLTAWEINFVEEMRVQIEGNVSLSQKQTEKLTDLWCIHFLGV